MLWTDTALHRAIVAEMERHDRPEGHAANVLPNGGKVGALVIIVICLSFLGLAPSKSAYHEPLAWIIVMPPLLLLLWARGAAKPIMESRQRRINEETSGRSLTTEAFVFYLRPFREDGRRPVTTSASSGSAAVLCGFWMDFELMLSQVLRWTLPVVALGDSKYSKGAGRKIVSDEEWRTAFEELGARCATIVCIPGHSASSIWELQKIRADSELLSKTVFFMPPRPVMKISNVIPDLIRGRTRRRWRATRLECSKFDLHLPEYRSNGCLFFVSKNGQVIRELELWNFDPARIEALCFASVVRSKISAEDFEIGLTALAARRPLPQTILARFMTRRTIPAGIWSPVVLGVMLNVLHLFETGVSP